jgi:hypothetical protein
MACGRLMTVDAEKVELAPIERPMRFADNGGSFDRDNVENIALILEAWR